MSIYYQFTSSPFTYDHRHWNARDPVRSPLVKPVIGGLVVGSVTTSEYPLLYVLFLDFIPFFLKKFLSVGFFLYPPPKKRDYIFCIFSNLFYLRLLLSFFFSSFLIKLLNCFFSALILSIFLSFSFCPFARILCSLIREASRHADRSSSNYIFRRPAENVFDNCNRSLHQDRICWVLVGDPFV